MSNKCPKCGFDYGEFDVFCARCGAKIEQEPDEVEIIKEEIDEEETIDEGKSIQDENLVRNILFSGDFKKNEFSTDKTKSFVDNPIVHFCVYMIALICLFAVGVHFVITKHTIQKSALQFKNFIANPQQIPLLYEPVNYSEFKGNIKKVETFLYLYLKYSTDSIDKKMQIFASYLDEIEKLPHIANENMAKGEIKECDTIIIFKDARACALRLNKEFKNTSISAFADVDNVYLYPDNNFIQREYSKFLSKDFKEYLKLKAKYNRPTSFGLNLKIPPKVLANKIYDYELLYNKTSDPYVKEQLEKVIYNDFRKFIFTPSIYATTTQEMRHTFKNAFTYFIKTKRNSALRPVVMSYMDKQRGYSEENFVNDYPYKIFHDDFEQSIQNNTFGDIFGAIRKNFAVKKSDISITYIYSVSDGSWKKYETNMPINSDEFLIDKPDENNNITVFNNTFSPLQELNIQKFSKLYLINNALYVFNPDKLSLSKFMYNGKVFIVHNLSSSDITSIFPGVEVINIDTFNSYNVLLEKDNTKANYIILSRYTDGWADYSLASDNEGFSSLILPNMFTVDNSEDVVVQFFASTKNTLKIDESSPSYTFTVHTKGQPFNNRNVPAYANFDEQTANEENNKELHTPNIMPKIQNETDETDETQEELQDPPAQQIEPPKDEVE